MHNIIIKQILEKNGLSRVEKLYLLNDVIKKHTFYENNSYNALMLGSGTVSFNYEYVSHYLFEDFRNHGANRAIELMEQRFKVTTMDIFVVAIVAGLENIEKIDINEDLFLLPIKKHIHAQDMLIEGIPETKSLASFKKRLCIDLMNIEDELAPYSDIIISPLNYINIPRIAVIHRIRNFSVFPSNKGIYKEQCQIIFSAEKNIRNLITIIPALYKSTPHIEAIFKVPGNEIFNSINTGNSHIGTIGLVANNFTAPKNIDWQLVSNIFENINNSDEDFQNKSFFISEMLNQAWLNDNSPAKILYLIIALELMINLKSKNSNSKAKTLSDRVAKLIYVSDKELLINFYKMRSDYAHEGKNYRENPSLPSNGLQDLEDFCIELSKLYLQKNFNANWTRYNNFDWCRLKNKPDITAS